MSNATLESVAVQGFTYVVTVVDVKAHIAKVKAAWRQHERAMAWEQKIQAIDGCVDAIRSWLALVCLLTQASPSAQAKGIPSAPSAHAFDSRPRPKPQTAGRRSPRPLLLHRDGRAGSA